MTNLKRDEFLFWRMIDISSGNRGDDSIMGQHGTMTGMQYDEISDDNICCLVRLSFCVNSKGVNVRIYTNYEGALSDERVDLSTKIPEYSIIGEKMFEWTNFVFDDLIGWINENSDWNKSAAKGVEYPTH